MYLLFSKFFEKFALFKVYFILHKVWNNATVFLIATSISTNTTDVIKKKILDPQLRQWLKNILSTIWIWNTLQLFYCVLPIFSLDIHVYYDTAFMDVALDRI